MVIIIGNVVIQIYLLQMVFSESQKKFSQTIQVALFDVIRKIYGYRESSMPESGPVKKVANDYYVVDVNNNINADVLEHYLRNEFRNAGIATDFEYGIYDCETDRMVYGNYVNYSDATAEKEIDTLLPKYPGLVYYFGIRFPNQANYIFADQKIWVILTVVSLVILLFFIFIIFMLLRQKRFSELQRDFVNNMAHEFKTPITATKIALDFIMNADAIKGDEKLNKYCNIIALQTDHLNRQVERILQLSVSEKSFSSVHRQSVDLGVVIEKVVSGFINSERNINVQKPERPVMIMADEIHTMNALNSLVDNAVKYSNPGTSIKISLFEEAGKSVLSISDEGMGIGKAEINRIFKKFYRVPSGDIHNVKGFGLGLYYVKQVAGMHGWKIKVKSTPGKGTEFIVVIKKNKIIF